MASPEHRGTARPLDGVRILDFTRLLPGAFATLLLADLGADIVKVEDPRLGDPMRHLAGSEAPSPYFEILNRNKRSMTLNLRSPGSRPVLDALAATSDVVVDSFRPSTARRLGLDAAALRTRHPRLICAAIAGFGMTGPYVDRAAHDINYQSLAGVVRPPELPRPLIADVGAAMQAAVGILAALVERSRTGLGSVVDISIHEAALAWSMFPTAHDLEGACYTFYETADDEWLALGALESKFWVAFCDRIGRADLKERQFARGEEGQRALDEVRALMKTRDRDEWLSIFADADVCLTTVNTPDQAAADPQLSARGVLAHLHGVTYVTRPGVRVIPAPALGAHTDAVLDAAGLDAERRAALRDRGII